jgi:hypothetical protein
MQSLFSRTPSSRSITQSPLVARDREFITRARRPPTPGPNVNPVFTRRRRPEQDRNRSRWFTRRRRDDRIVPIASDDIIGAETVEPVQVAIPRQNSVDSNRSAKENPVVRSVDLSEVPEYDNVSEMPIEFAEVVGQDGSTCCLPGRYAQNCRICPERMQVLRERPMLMRNPSAVEPEKMELGGRKRKRRTVRRGRKKQLKKRHYRKSRKH